MRDEKVKQKISDSFPLEVREGSKEVDIPAGTGLKSETDILSAATGGEEEGEVPFTLPAKVSSFFPTQISASLLLFFSPTDLSSHGK